MTPPRPGDAIGAPILLTALWFEGKMLSAERGRGGGAICWDALLEGGNDAIRGEGVARGRGDGGTELRSGAIAVFGNDTIQHHMKISKDDCLVDLILWVVVIAVAWQNAFACSQESGTITVRVTD